MPLREHLVELRRRVVVAALSVLVGAVPGWFLYDTVFSALQRPFTEVQKHRSSLVAINFSDITGAFNLKFQLSIYLGIILSSPVWLYQIWAFITPGLTRRERRYSTIFVLSAVPLFVGGIAVGWFVLPNAVSFLIGITPHGATNITQADQYFRLVTRLLMAFGLAFVSPLFLIGLNLVGVLRARTMLKAWRVTVFLIFLFAALASPTPDASSMIILAMSLVTLFAAAVGISFLVDRRRDRRRAAETFASLPDDEASAL